MMMMMVMMMLTPCRSKGSPKILGNKEENPTQNCKKPKRKEAWAGSSGTSVYPGSLPAYLPVPVDAAAFLDLCPQTLRCLPACPEFWS
ncbi:hypothetical protein F4780DRAFT_64008 [Xylariomycetidae sp. FL0641]|nr:hypothetical protein F4780DRAFT_64008 [Xylariomycetidae sp. FL0641]